MRSRSATAVVACLAAGSAVLYPSVSRCWRDSRATDVIEAYGGCVSMPIPDVTVVMSTVGTGRPQTFGDGQLADLIPVLPDVDHFDALDLRQTQVTDAGVARLTVLMQLRRLYVGGTPVTAAGLLQLRVLPDLSEISVSAGQLSPANVRAIAVAMPKVAVDVWH